MFRVVGFHGVVGAGKNEAARAIESTHVPVAFADKMREGLLALNPIIDYRYEVDDEQSRTVVLVRLREFVEKYGWDEAKKHPEVRRLMQSFGTEAGRKIHGYYCWVILAGQTIKELLHDGKNVAATDVRFKEEEEAIHGFGGIVLKIVKPNNGPVNDHRSEHQTIKVDGVIINDGNIDELHAKVRDFVNCCHAPPLNQW